MTGQVDGVRHRHSRPRPGASSGDEDVLQLSFVGDLHTGDGIKRASRAGDVVHAGSALDVAAELFLGLGFGCSNRCARRLVGVIVVMARRSPQIVSGR